MPNTIANENADRLKYLYNFAYKNPINIPAITCIIVCTFVKILCNPTIDINIIHNHNGINLYKYKSVANIVIVSE